MMKRSILLYVLFAASFVACGQVDSSRENPTPSEAPASSKPDYVVMGDDLQILKDDFNANQGRVRLVFLSGPTCGICLRGLADLNDEFIAAGQNDERFVTFIVHVPTMGAKEHHAVDSMPLLDGPRVHHYWEESGIIGQHYTEVMDVDMYVWDFWAIYGPDAVWEGMLPPVPDYYEHQLGITSGKFRGFPREKVLDAERFAAETRKHIDEVDGHQFTVQVAIDQIESERVADGTLIPVVGQPRNVAVRQHIIGRGGYKNLKRITSMEARGHIETQERSFDLSISSARPNLLRRLVGVVDEISVAELNNKGEALIDSETGRGLPAELEQELLRTFEFDGMFVEWPEKGHDVSMVGMLKIGDVLTWKLDLRQKSGAHWNLFLDSHTGGIVRAELLDVTDSPAYIIKQSDFRDDSGFTFPYRIEYFDSTGRSLAVETIDEIEVNQTPFEIELEAVAH